MTTHCSFGELEDGDVFLFTEGNHVCAKETFPGQQYSIDIPVPNYFRLFLPKYYGHSGDEMRVIKLGTLSELYETMDILYQVGLI